MCGSFPAAINLKTDKQKIQKCIPSVKTYPGAGICIWSQCVKYKTEKNVEEKTSTSTIWDKEIKSQQH